MRIKNMPKNTKFSQTFLPATAAEMHSLGWDQPDIILVTGDAYIDHPAFGIALIGRLLESKGYRVAVLSQPRHDTDHDFKQFGPPRLFWGITAGNLDSIVANYTGNGKVRDTDQYSPGGNPYFAQIRSKNERRRPDRATIRYTNLARSAFAELPIVLGGLEASLRRFVHYDYQQNKLRSSVLTDAKADILVYGMGERAVVEIATRIDSGRDLIGIDGTCLRLTDNQMSEVEGQIIKLPSFDEIQKNKGDFLTAELEIDKQARALSSSLLCQKQQAMWVVQNPPAQPLSQLELDDLYGLPFQRLPHDAAKDVPAYNMICHSITIVRGCFGNCSFCAISRHQGPVVTWRSRSSILAEAKELAELKNFHGTLTDLGGPTANLYGTSCSVKGCKKHDCLHDGVCRHLQIDEKSFIDLLDGVVNVAHIKNAFISSGLRMELLLLTPKLLEKILNDHTPGAMKIAPEHTEPNVLKLMHKQHEDVLPAFLEMCRNISQKTGKKYFFTPYIISAHPGCRQEDMQALGAKIKKLGLPMRQFQDFTPTPGTISTAMYVSGLDRDTGKTIHVARNDKERRAQRLILEKLLPASKKTRRK